MNKIGEKIIILAAFVLVIVIGCIVVFGLNNKNSNIFTQGTNKKENLETDRFYYSETLLMKEDSYFYGLSKSMHRYESNIVKLKIDFKINDEIDVTLDVSNASLYNLTNNEQNLIIPDSVLDKDIFTINKNQNFLTVHYVEKDDAVAISEISTKGKIITQNVLQEYGGPVYIGENGQKFASIEKIEEDDEYYYVQYSTGEGSNKCLQIFKKDGTPYHIYDNVRYFDIDFLGNLFMYLKKDGAPSILQKVCLVKPNEIIFSQKIDLCHGILYSMNETKIYCVEENGIVTYDEQFENSGLLTKTNVLTFGEDSTFFLNDGEFIVSDFRKDSNDSLYMSVWNIGDEKGDTKYYRFDKVFGMRPEREITLSITAPYRQDFLSSAILRYEMINKDQKIDYNYRYNTREEFIENSKQYGQQLISKVLSGDIGDIVMTGGSELVYKDIFLTDAFIDLSDFIGNDKNYNKLNRSAIEGLRIAGEIKGLPIGIITPYVIVNKATAESLGLKIDFDNITWKEALDMLTILEEKNPELFLFASSKMGKDVNSIITNILISNMPDLIDLENKTIDLKQQWFVELVEKFKIIMKKQNFYKRMNTSNSNYLDNALFSIIDFDRGDYGNLMGLYVMENQDNSKDSLYIPMFIGEISSNRISYTNNMYSINTASQNKEAAERFLSFLLEDDIQRLLTDYSGRPINLVAQNKMFIEQKKMILRNYPNDEYADIFINSIEKINSQIDYLYDMDYMKADIIDQLELYFNDEISLENALEKAEESIVRRLNE